MAARFLLLAAALAAAGATKGSKCENCTHMGLPFSENFQSGTLHQFVLSKQPKYAGQPVAVEHPTRYPGEANDLALVLQRPAHHYAVAAQFFAPVTTDEGLVVQYESRFQEGLQCGGAYVKLLNSTEDFSADRIDNDSPYVIMFGPDKCGSTDKVHFIVRFRNPVDGSVEEKHLVDAPHVPSDRLSHLYTLVIRPDDSFAIKIDNAIVKEGSMTSDTLFAPPILPKPEIDDPSDVKPADWVDEAKIKDPSASKPDDWDENAPEMILDEAAMKPAGWLDDEPDFVPDPSAQKPDGWDDEEDGDWEAPMVENPKCKAAPGCGEWRQPMKRNPAFKGKWTAPLIDNPAYRGPWKPRQIANPTYFTDSAVHRLSGARIGAIAVEVWTMQGGISFDNFLVTTDEAAATEAGETGWRMHHATQEGAMKREDREQRKAERLEAYSKGGFFDKVGFYAAEAMDFAAEYPLTFAGIIGGVVVLGVVACFCMMSSPSADEGAEYNVSPAGAHHGHSHDHGAHGHSHGGDSDNEGEKQQAGGVEESDKEALKKAAAALRKSNAQAGAAFTEPAATAASAPAPAPAPEPAAAEAAPEEAADSSAAAADASPASGGGVRKRATAGKARRAADS